MTTGPTNASDALKIGAYDPTTESVTIEVNDQLLRHPLSKAALIDRVVAIMTKGDRVKRVTLERIDPTPVA